MNAQFLEAREWTGLDAATFLILDDNPDDLLLLERALSRSSIRHELTAAGDGFEAQEWLEAHENGPDAAPMVILSDLNMPRCNGLELLAWLKADARFNRSPVVLISSFDNPADMERAVELGAEACVRKPPNASELDDLLARIAPAPPRAPSTGGSKPLEGVPRESLLILSSP
jgi:CheY-like chemotaxis protein